MGIEFEIDLGGNLGDEAKGQASAVQLLAAQLKQLQGISGQMDTMNEKLGGAMGDSSESMKGAALSADELGIAAEAAVVAIAALAAAAIAGGAALAVMAGEDRQAFEAMTAAMGGSAEAGAQLNEVVEKLKDALPLTKDQLQKLSGGLIAAGIRDAPALEKALRALGAASALGLNTAKVQSFIEKTEMFAEAGKNFGNFTKQLKGTGVTIEDLAKQFGKPAKELEQLVKSGKISAQQLGDAFQDALINKGANAVEVANQKLSVMWGKMKSAIMDVFEGVVDTPGYKAFIHAIQQIGILFGMFAGDAKKAVTSAFGVIFGIIAKVLTFGIVYGLKFAAVLLKVYVATFPVIHAMMEFGRWLAGAYAWLIKTIVANDTFVTGLKVLGGVLALVASPFILMGVIAAAVVAGIVALTAAIVYVAGWIAKNFIPILKTIGLILISTIAMPIALVIGAITLFGDAIAGVAKKLASWAKKGYEAARDFVAGVIMGIEGGAQKVEGVSAGLGDSAKKAMQKALDSHSPSRVGMMIGKDFGAGVAIGVGSSQSHVMAASADLGGSVMYGTSSGASGGKSGGGDVYVTVEKGAIVVGGGGGGMLEMTEEALALMLERIAEEAGLLPQGT